MTVYLLLANPIKSMVTEHFLTRRFQDHILESRSRQTLQTECRTVFRKMAANAYQVQFP